MSAILLRRVGREALRFIALLAVAAVALQLCWLLRIASMAVVDPQSTTFQRSEAWRLLRAPEPLTWRHTWVAGDRIAPNLKRAAIAAEDAGFTEHHGIEWDALERAGGRNQRAEARVDAANAQSNPRNRLAASARPISPREPKRVGGSTITQQLAKNLFLSGERNWPRKAQELVIAGLLEALLTKPRILEIYLNHVEWGEGTFGAQAAAQRHFRVDALDLGAAQAARLAVMLPAPKRFERQGPSSVYLAGRAATVEARMGGVELP